jgi:hypothetical protein
MHCLLYEITSFIMLQSVPITTNVASLNPAHGEVYSIHYVISLSVTYCRSVIFFHVLVFSSNKTDHHDITEILLKVTLNTITP